MDDQSLIDRWCNSQKARGLSDRTIKRRRSTVERFAERHQLETATAIDVEDWLASLAIKPQSRGLYLSDLRTFYLWAVKRDYFATEPTIKVDAPKRPKYVPRPIETSHLQRAIEDAPPRIKLMLTLAGYAGLRATEIASLRCEDVNHENRTLRVVGKGSKPRVIRMHKRVADLIPVGATGPVILHERHKGQHVSAATVSKVLSHYLKNSAGLNATGHQARHTYGSRMYAECKNLLTVGQQMGHESSDTTKGYVAFSDDDARAAIDALD